MAYFHLSRCSGAPVLPSAERASGSMTVATRVGFLDTQRCSSGEPLSALLSAPPPPLTFEGGAVL